LRGNVGYYTGSGAYRNNDNTRVNAKYFLVQLRNGTDSLLGQGNTDSDGNFVINIDNPGASGVKPVLYAYHNWTVGEVDRTQLFDRELRVVRQGTTLSGLEDVYSFALRDDPQQFPDGDHNFGTLDVPKGDQYERACWLLDDLNRAFLYTPSDPGGCTIKWSPSSTDGTCFNTSDKQVHLKGDDPISSDILLHEYGHNVMYTVYGQNNPPYDCPTEAEGGHWIGGAYKPVCAWMEGWADFFPLAIENNPIFHRAKVHLIEDNYDFEKGEGASQTWAVGDICEGRVGGALWDLLDNTPDEGSDWYSFGFNPIWDTMVNNGVVVNNFRDFWNTWLGKGNSIYAANCLLQNTIDYLPSKNIALRASNGQYLCAEGGGGHGLIADRNWIGRWETFKLIDLGSGNVALQASDGQYVCAEGGGGGLVVANRNHFDAWETFTLKDLGNGNVALQAYNGKWVCAQIGSDKKVVANRDAQSTWETFKLIDLTQQPVALKASNGQYVCAQFGGGDGIVADRSVRSTWETFGLIRLESNNVALRASNGQYVCAENGGGDGLYANRDWIGTWETFKLIDRGGGNIALQANNNNYVCAENGGGSVVVANRNAIGAWEIFGLSQLTFNTAQANKNTTTEIGNVSVSKGEDSDCASCQKNRL